MLAAIYVVPLPWWVMPLMAAILAAIVGIALWVALRRDDH